MPDHDIGPEPDDDFDDDGEMEIECPHCVDGWVDADDGLKAECAECGGTGWY